MDDGEMKRKTDAMSELERIRQLWYGNEDLATIADLLAELSPFSDACKVQEDRLDKAVTATEKLAGDARWAWKVKEKMADEARSDLLMKSKQFISKSAKDLCGGNEENLASVLDKKQQVADAALDLLDKEADAAKARHAAARARKEAARARADLLKEVQKFAMERADLTRELLKSAVDLMDVCKELKLGDESATVRVADDIRGKAAQSSTSTLGMTATPRSSLTSPVVRSSATIPATCSSSC